MLDRESGATSVHEFVVFIEIEDGKLEPEKASLKLADALAWVEGTGAVDIIYKGQISPNE